MRDKTCPTCREKFAPVRPLQVACSIECAIRHTQNLKAKRERKEHRERKAKLKSRADYAREAQTAINAYVRARDAGLGCVSCGRPATWDGQWHASHFRSVGAAPSVRFNLWNIHKACSICNNWKSGNLAEYTPRLIAKIGAEKVEWLYSQNAPKKYDIPYLQRLARVFRKKTKRLLARSKA